MEIVKLFEDINMGKSFKERKLRVLLDKYIKDESTNTDWLLKVVPDLVEFEFINMRRVCNGYVIGTKDYFERKI